MDTVKDQSTLSAEPEDTQAAKPEDMAADNEAAAQPPQENTEQPDQESSAEPDSTAAVSPAEEAADTAEAPEQETAETDVSAEVIPETVSAAQPEVTAEAPADDTAAASYSGKQLLNDVMDLLESVITSVFIVIIMFTFLFCVANVDGESMVPTLLDGDRLIIRRIGRNYHTGDILILDSSESYTFGADQTLVKGDGLGKRIVKRLIATEGQEVYIDFAAGIVYVDNQPLNEPYTNTLTTRDEGAFDYPITVPEGYVFVLGDNRSVSKDSRHPDVGLIPESDIIGEVVLRIAPLSAFGTVD